MIKTTSVILLLGISKLLVAAPVIKLAGTVSKTGGGPLYGVAISLKNIPDVSVHTDSSGNFSLTIGTAVQHKSSRAATPAQFTVTRNGVIVQFSPMPAAFRGAVSLFSANGTRLYCAGISSVKPAQQLVPLSAFAPGLNILTINMNGTISPYSFLGAGKNLLVNRDNSSLTTSNNKTTAPTAAEGAIDTLTAKKGGYSDRKIPLASYTDTTLTITIDSISGTACTPPTSGTGKSNPLFTDVYTADPAVMVDNCTFYIACGHDQGTGGFDLREWYLLKSTDMVTWTRTTPMNLKTFTWTNANAWAGQMIKASNGKYYWYVPINDIVYSKDRMAIGVAVADSPEGPWKDALGKPLINDSLEMATWGITTIDQTPHTIDPTVFIDDDGQAYLQYGGFWTMVTVKLNPDMISISGKLVKTTPLDYFESPYLVKRNNLYYEIYARGSANPTSIDYATSNSPMGPWTHKGTILPEMQNVAGQDEPTNHAAVAEFAGEWYIVYHVSNGPNGGGTYKRQVAIDKLFFNSDGSIKPVTPGAGLSF